MNRYLVTAVTLISSFLIPVLAAAQPTGARDFWSGPGWGMGHMVFGGLMMIAFWGTVILLIVLAVRWLTTAKATDRRDERRPAPLEILQERFARGEIDKDEYEERRKILSG